MPDLRWAVMGAGRIAAGVLPRLLEARGCRVVCVAASDPRRARALAESAPLTGPAASCGYEDLLRRDDVDCVYLTLMNHLHEEWCLRLLEAGKHVLCEKPLVPSARQAQRIAHAADAAGRLCVEGFMYMHHPQTARLIEIARAGDGGPIGRLLRIRSHRCNRMTDPGQLATRLSHACQAGCLMDVGCYPVSAARLLAGCEMDPASLRASATMADPAPGENRAVDAACDFSWTFENGVEFEARCSFLESAGIFLELIGERGTAYTTHPYGPDAHRQVLLVNGREEVFENAGDKFTLQFEAFAAAVRAERDPFPPLSWSIAQAAAIEAIHRKIGLEF